MKYSTNSSQASSGTIVSCAASNSAPNAATPAYCSPECRQRAYRDNNLLTTLTLNLDVMEDMVLREIAEANGVSRQHIVQ